MTQLALNPDPEILDSYEPQRGGTKDSDPCDQCPPGSDAEYVIITRQEFIQAFLPLLDHKRQRLTAEIAWLDGEEGILLHASFETNSPCMMALHGITETYYDPRAGEEKHNDEAARIRNFIRYAYHCWGTRFVLLGGDADGGADPNCERQEPLVPGRALAPGGDHVVARFQRQFVDALFRDILLKGFPGNIGRALTLGREHLTGPARLLCP